MLAQQFPLVTADPSKLEEQARGALPPVAYNCVAGGAREHATIVANRIAYMHWKIIPRILWPTGKKDLYIDLFGERCGNAPALITMFLVKLLMGIPWAHLFRWLLLELCQSSTVIRRPALRNLWEDWGSLHLEYCEWPHN